MSHQPTKSAPPTLLAIAWPIFVEQSLRILIGTVDTFMVAHVSDGAVAALGVSLEVVGAEEEQEQRVYSQGDYIYLGSGAAQNVKVGELYVVTRPRGGVRRSPAGHDVAMSADRFTASLPRARATSSTAIR